MVGFDDGLDVGGKEGDSVVIVEGMMDGKLNGITLLAVVGADERKVEGTALGSTEGTSDGWIDGWDDGNIDGDTVGSDDGNIDGDTVGSDDDTVEV